LQSKVAARYMRDCQEQKVIKWRRYREASERRGAWPAWLRDSVMKDDYVCTSNDKPRAKCARGQRKNGPPPPAPAGVPGRAATLALVPAVWPRLSRGRIFRHVRLRPATPSHRAPSVGYQPLDSGVCWYALSAGSPFGASRMWVRTSRGAYQPGLRPRVVFVIAAPRLAQFLHRIRRSSTKENEHAAL